MRVLTGLGSPTMHGPPAVHMDTQSVIGHNLFSHRYDDWSKDLRLLKHASLELRYRHIISINRNVKVTIEERRQICIKHRFAHVITKPTFSLIR